MHPKVTDWILKPLAGAAEELNLNLPSFLTQMEYQKGTELTSNCRYHFKGMQYLNATATFRATVPFLCKATSGY
jgi:hypothetical protein